MHWSEDVSQLMVDQHAIKCRIKSNLIHMLPFSMDNLVNCSFISFFTKLLLMHIYLDIL